MRAFLFALGLSTILLGLFLVFTGYVGVGCTVGGTTANPTQPKCAAATDLEIGGIVLTVAATLLFAGALVPERSAGAT